MFGVTSFQLNFGAKPKVMEIGDVYCFDKSNEHRHSEGRPRTIIRVKVMLEV